MTAAAGQTTPTAAMPTATAPGPSLRDIHLPAEPSWWPPAPGWWLIAALVLLAIAVAAWAWRRHRRSRRRQQRVLDELDLLARRHRDDGDRAALLRDLHQLLRRVARQHDAEAIRQRGDTWRQTLARVPVDVATLDRLHALDLLIYQPPGECDEAVIVKAARQWLRLAVKPSNWKAVAAAAETADA